MTVPCALEPGTVLALSVGNATVAEMLGIAAGAMAFGSLAAVQSVKARSCWLIIPSSTASSANADTPALSAASSRIAPIAFLLLAIILFASTAIPRAAVISSSSFEYILPPTNP